jgi:hypothetical protein
MFENDLATKIYTISVKDSWRNVWLFARQVAADEFGPHGQAIGLIPSALSSEGGEFVQELTSEIRDKILEAVRKLYPIDVVALEAGVSKTTLNEWRELGMKENSGKYRDLVLAMEKADKVGIKNNLDIIITAANSGDKGAQNWLKEHENERLVP